jgi:hypothetical protein
MKKLKEKKEEKDRSEPYSLFPLNCINLAYIKSLCDNYKIQINFIFKPDQIQFRISKINSETGCLSKSEQHIFKNHEISQKLTTSTLEIIIRKLMNNWYPNNILST